MTHATHMITSPERLQFAGRRNIAAGGAVWRQAMPAAMLLAVVAAASPVHATSLVAVTSPVVYADGRPYPSYRMNAVDLGKFLNFGGAPNGTDNLGIREALINQVDGTYYLYYDGAGPTGWLAHLAVSTDLTNWELKGPILGLGAPGTTDSGSASAPWIIKDEANVWQMFYLGTPNTSGGTDKIPSIPYKTLRATAASPAGPWTKQYVPVPFDTVAGTYYSLEASPGHVVKQGNDYLMFFSAMNSNWKRTIAIARTRNLAGTWTVDAAPALPVTEQIENSSLYYEPANQTWFLFTNHIGLDGGEYTDGVWVYWTKDLNSWNPADKAVVLDGSNCTWSSKCIGMPSVVVVGDKLFVYYDAPGGTSTSHMQRSLGRATLQLPLDPTVAPDNTAPVIQQLVPPNAGTQVAPAPVLKVSFDENITKGTGSILIKSFSGNAIVQNIDVNSANVTVSGALMTIDPPANLGVNTRYFVEIASRAITDSAGNPFLGISGNATWSFTTASSNTTQIFVGDHSFEAGKSLGGWVPGGTAGPGQSTGSLPSPWVGPSGVGWVGTGQYNDPMPDGDIYLYCNQAVTVSQTLAETLQPNTTYTLTVAVGWRKDLPGYGYPNFPGYKIELWAGGNLLAAQASATGFGGSGADPAAGRWLDVAATYTSPAGVTPGQTLQIRLYGLGIQTDYDNVRLVATTQTPSNAFNSWISNPAFGLAPADQGFADDLDGDGIPNALEAWFGTHPGQFNSGLAHLVTHGLTTTFTHPQAELPPSDVSGIYQWSPNLVDWYAGDGIDGPPGGQTVTMVPSTVGNTTTVTVTASGALERLFLRIVAVMT